MNLGELRAEVENHGFDPGLFPDGRIVQYLNDAQNLIARRVNFYTDETTSPVNVTAGVSVYALPTDFARERSLFDASRNMELQVVSLREIDRSSHTATGAPSYYSLTGQGVQLYPTPDAVYTLTMRYWKMPAALVADTDVPVIPAAWHRILWYWAVKECYAAEDDLATAQQWEQQFNTTMAEFSADVKFPGELPTQVEGMWERDQSIVQPGYLAYLGW